MNILDRESFCKVIEQVKTLAANQDRLDAALRDMNCEGWVIWPDGSGTITEILKVMFRDRSDWIDYFCYELDFGREYKPGTVTKDNEDVPLSSAGELWDLLMDTFYEDLYED